MSFDALFRDDAGGSEPPDGLHVAVLERSDVFEGRSGWLIKTYWRTQSGGHNWEVINGLGEQQVRFTRDNLSALGIDWENCRREIDEDTAAALKDALAAREGLRFDVSVVRKNGYLNTYVESAVAVQETFSDLPPATEDLPPAPATAGSTSYFDDDIPF